MQQVQGYVDSSDDLMVCLFQSDGGKMTRIKANQVRTRLRSIVQVIGEETLGFGSKDINLYSLQSGGSMATFLSGTSTIVIKKDRLMVK